MPDDDAQVTHVNLDAHSQENLADLHAYVVRRLARFPRLPRKAAEDFGYAVTDRSGGSFLFVRLLLDRLLASLPEEAALDELRRALNRVLDEPDPFRPAGGSAGGQGEGGQATPDKPPKNPAPVTDEEDPHKGRWGGLPERGGRRLSATVEALSKKRYIINLEVASVDGSTLIGPVFFHIHPSFPRSPQRITRIIGGKRAVFEEIISEGSFTVGAQVKDKDNQWVNLELDLAELPGVSKHFRQS